MDNRSRYCSGDSYIERVKALKETERVKALKQPASRSAEDEPISSKSNKSHVESPGESDDDQYKTKRALNERHTLVRPAFNKFLSETAVSNLLGSKPFPPVARRVPLPSRLEPSTLCSMKPSNMEQLSSSQDLSRVVEKFSLLETKLDNYKDQVVLYCKAQVLSLEKKQETSEERAKERAKEDSVRLTKILDEICYMMTTNIESGMENTRSDLECVLKEMKDYINRAAVFITKSSYDNLRGVSGEELFSRAEHPMNHSVPTNLPSTPGGQPTSSSSGSLDFTPASERKWGLPGVAITFRIAGENRQIGVIREAMLDGKFRVAVGPSGDGDIVVVTHSEMELVVPKKTDHVKIVSGRLRDSTGKLIGIDGTHGIVKMDDSLDFKSLDMSSLVKVVALQPSIDDLKDSEKFTFTFGSLEPQSLNGVYRWHEPRAFSRK